MRRTGTIVGLTLITGALLAGCATVGGSGSGSASPTASSTATQTDLGAAWLDGGRMIGLVTTGSSTCVPTAGDVAVTGAQLTVTLVEPDASTPCTLDLVPRATLITVPAGIDPTKDLEISASGPTSYGDTVLKGVTGLATVGDYLPSAGWTGLNGTFAIVTWGSSSCKPVVEDAAVTGAAEITVTFQTPAADQVCTADMGPRVTLATVEGAPSGANVEVVLTGGGSDTVRIPIAGSN